MLAPTLQTAPRHLLVTAPLLSGTVPVRPINPGGFVGTVEQDGQIVKVAAIAFDERKVALMSLVGRDTSVSAVMAQIWKKKEAVFQPAQDVEWQERPQVFKRLDDHYKQFATQLPGLKIVHAIAIPLGANIAAGILNAPHMHKDPRQENRRVPQVETRYVLGNVQEETPNALSVLGHLRAMRVVLLYQDDAHPERLVIWASELWQRGISRQLVVPLPALGVHVWKILPDVSPWNALVAEGIHQGWLPW
jgi:hypothetical protein